MKKSRFTNSQIMDALKRVEAGLPVPELCRDMGISTATFYKWRSKYVGMDICAARRSYTSATPVAPGRFEKLHWRLGGCTVIGRGHQGVLVTLLEHKSRYTLACRLDSRHSAKVTATVIELLRPYKA